MSNETMTVPAPETIDLKHRCALCPETAPLPRKPRASSPGGWKHTDDQGRPFNVPEAKQELPPVSWHGTFQPYGLHASSRTVHYGLCAEHGHDVWFNDGSQRLELALLKFVNGNSRVPLSEAKS